MKTWIIAVLVAVSPAVRLGAASCCIDLGSAVSTIAGTGANGHSGDGGPATSAELGYTGAIGLDPAGNVYFSDEGRLRRIDAVTGIITTVVGNGTYGLSGDGGPGLLAQIGSITGMAWYGGKLYLSAESNHEIRTYEPSTGIIDRICGNGISSFGGDGGPALSAYVMNPRGIAFDGGGNLYFSDVGSQFIRKIDSAGLITTVAGSGTNGYAPDGSIAFGSHAGFPEAVAVLPSGEVTFYEDTNHLYRMIDSSGRLQTLAGQLGSGGYSGDGGPGNAAQIGDVEGSVLGCNGQLLLAEYFGRIRMLDNSGNITAVAGTGNPTFNGDGLAGVTNIAPVFGGIAIDSFGSVYISDSPNHRIRKIVPVCPYTFTETPTSSTSPTPTISPTYTISPTVSSTPSVTPTVCPTSTFTPTPEPLVLSLPPPSPNPGSNEIWLPYTLSRDADVDIEIYTVAGEKVRHLDSVWSPPGTSEQSWNVCNEAGRKVASGIFIYRVRAHSPVGEEKTAFSKCAVAR